MLNLLKAMFSRFKAPARLLLLTNERVSRRFVFKCLFCCYSNGWDTGQQFNQAQSLEKVMVAGGLSFLERTCNTAQCSGCQLGCPGGQNLPCSIYRRIICSCSYCMEHPKILLYQLLEKLCSISKKNNMLRVVG